MSPTSDAAAHWNAVYDSRAVDEVSWFQISAGTSVRLLRGPHGLPRSVVDVGAGTSPLVDELLDAGCEDVTVLDVSEEALAVTRARLAARAEQVSFVVSDVLAWRPGRQYDAWHDRAVFHFLTEPAQRAAYVETAARAVVPGGVAVLGVFAEDGPTRCSGLPTARYSAADLATELGERFTLEHAEREEHTTPGGAVQAFTWVRLRRTTPRS